METPERKGSRLLDRTWRLRWLWLPPLVLALVILLLLFVLGKDSGDPSPYLYRLGGMPSRGDPAPALAMGTGMAVRGGSQ